MFRMSSVPPPIEIIQPVAVMCGDAWLNFVFRTSPLTKIQGILPKGGCGVLVVGALVGERSWARAEGSGKASKTKSTAQDDNCKSCAKRRGDAECLPWGRDPKAKQSASSPASPNLVEL